MSALKEQFIGKWDRKVSDLADQTRYEFEFLWDLWNEVYAEHTKTGETEEEAWKYFEEATLEEDW